MVNGIVSMVCVESIGIDRSNRTGMWWLCYWVGGGL